MPTNYKDLSERDKQVSNLQHLDTLDANTDQIETKLDSVISGLGTVASKLDILAGKIDTANGLLGDIKTNTTPQA